MYCLNALLYLFPILPGNVQDLLHQNDSNAELHFLNKAMRKSVFLICEKAKLKQVCSSIEIIWSLNTVVALILITKAEGLISASVRTLIIIWSILGEWL